MTEPRLTSEFWIKAHLRRCAVENVPAFIVRHGFDTAGTILVKLNRLDQGCTVYAPVTLPDGGRGWEAATGRDPVPEADADAYIARQIKFDPDLWVIEIEDRQGRHFLDGVVG